MPQRQADRFALARRVPVFFLALMAVFLFFASSSELAESQTYKVIHNFTDKGTDGATP
jgi:hypothetical protein